MAEGGGEGGRGGASKWLRVALSVNCHAVDRDWNSTALSCPLYKSPRVHALCFLPF